MVDVVGETAVVSFAFAMVYERDGASYRATGRDLWVFGQRRETMGGWRCGGRCWTRARSLFERLLWTGDRRALVALAGSKMPSPA